MATATRAELEEMVEEAEAHPYEFRMTCLKLADHAQQVAGDMAVDKVMDRSLRYWEFVAGVDDELAVLTAVRKVMNEPKGTA